MVVRILESNKEIEARILFVLKDQIDAAFKKAKKPIELGIRQIIRTAILSSPTTLSLISGQLKADFGLTTELANTAVASLVVLVGDNISVDFIQNAKTGLNFSIVVNLDAIDRAEVKAVAGGSYDNYGNYGISEINWLDWLLTQGTQVIISGFSVEYKASPFSRSGLAIMTEGGAFRVAPEHAGILTDNFITRAIAGSFPIITDLIKVELQKVL